MNLIVAAVAKDGRVYVLHYDNKKQWVFVSLDGHGTLYSPELDLHTLHEAAVSDGFAIRMFGDYNEYIEWLIEKLTEYRYGEQEDAVGNPFPS
ncbi:MAG: hypothetical protein GY861_22115 [bacterium]|nr:hypothetical protein [bacterium]